MFKIELVDYEDLTEDQREIVPNNGCGKEMANYLKMTCGNDSIIISDAVEPEDATFRRDFNEVINMVEQAYEFGRSVKEGD